ncbi:MAG TPA: cation:proton antiporter [Candidatus Pacearchaeota archaeon]|nr:cation:proton antiporter [Candidatus Pacearchaeota archaeon]
MEIILFLAGIFLLTYLVGIMLEKIRVPWVFAPLLIGLGLSAYNPFTEVTSSETFIFLAQLGMYFLLFSIGFELNLKKMMKSSKFIIKTTSVVILSEAIVASIMLHYIFDLSWIISFLLSLSFATIGEAILLPILNEFRLTKTKFGQTILSIGIVDDIFEVITIIAVTILLGYSAGSSSIGIGQSILILISLFTLTFLLIKNSERIQLIKYKNNSLVFLVIMFFFFLLLGIGNLIGAAALGALFAGIVSKKIIPPKSLKTIHSQIKILTYGFFAPIFFLWVGLDVNINHLIEFPLLILLFTIVTYLVKATASFAMTRSQLGDKKAFLLGISLCVRLSTSIVIIKLLLEHHLITSEIYSILVGTQLIFKFIIPITLSYFITKWKIAPKIDE